MLANMELETKEMEVSLNEKEDKILKNKKKNNIELYKKYRIFSYDLIFYYSIIYLFLTIEKGISAAEVLKFDAFYILFKCLMQIPVTIIIQKIREKKKHHNSKFCTCCTFINYNVCTKF
jgi:hypothetical protein